MIYKIFFPLDSGIRSHGQPAYTPIGWQPFDRPEQQRANAYRLKIGEDFARVSGVAKFRFEHKWQVSKQIYEAFEGGDALFPPDPLADFAEHVKCLTQYSQAQIDKVFRVFAERTGKTPDKETYQAWLVLVQIVEFLIA